MGKSGKARWAAVIRSRTKSQSSREALTTAEAALTAPLGILQSRLEESTTGTRGQATQHGKNHKAGSIRDKHRPQRPRRRIPHMIVGIADIQIQASTASSPISATLDHGKSPHNRDHTHIPLLLVH